MMSRVYWGSVIGSDGVQAAIVRCVHNFTLRNGIAPNVVQVRSDLVDPFLDGKKEISVPNSVLKLRVERVDSGLPKGQVRVYKE